MKFRMKLLSWALPAAIISGCPSLAHAQSATQEITESIGAEIATPLITFDSVLANNVSVHCAIAPMPAKKQVSFYLSSSSYIPFRCIITDGTGKEIRRWSSKGQNVVVEDIEITVFDTGKFYLTITDDSGNIITRIPFDSQYCNRHN